MSDDEQLRIKYESEMGCYQAWGEYVCDHILAELEKQSIDPQCFLKIYPVIPRVKDIQSYLDKAHSPQKKYTDPDKQITDKVGIRFVVLTENDIESIKIIIEKWTSVSYSNDNDYEITARERPEYFSYKSVHYVVRNNLELKHNGQIIQPNTPCEIQIRTLLQHAWAEVSHNEIYKKKEDIDPAIKRKMARSVAFIEATDEVFLEVHSLINNEEDIFNKYIQNLQKFINYTQEYIFLKNINKTIYNAYSKQISDEGITSEVVINFMKEDNYKFLIKKIQNGRSNSLLYQQPILGLIYYLINKKPEKTRALWPLTEDELSPLYNDLGYSISE